MRVREEDTRSEGEGVTEGAVGIPRAGVSVGMGAGDEGEGGKVDPRRAPGGSATHLETHLHSPHSQERSRNLPRTPL